MSVHRETFTGLVQAHRWTRGVELGVDKGILFGMLLKNCPQLSLIGVDTFPDHVRSRRVFELVESYPDRATVLAMPTADASANVDEGSQDFVFVDADHSEAAVTDDLARWRSKVRSGGWFGGHDYHPQKFPGVVAAVRRAFGSRVELLPGTIWGVWC